MVSRLKSNIIYDLYPKNIFYIYNIVYEVEDKNVEN